jgi:hypothetical protein
MNARESAPRIPLFAVPPQLHRGPPQGTYDATLAVQNTQRWTGAVRSEEQCSDKLGACYDWPGRLKTYTSNWLCAEKAVSIPKPTRSLVSCIRFCWTAVGEHKSDAVSRKVQVKMKGRHFGTFRFGKPSQHSRIPNQCLYRAFHRNRRSGTSAFQPSQQPDPMLRSNSI